MDVKDILSSRVIHFASMFNEEVELGVIQYPDHYYVYASICNDRGEFLGVGKDLVERDAARKALKELYVNAYDR
ncbi:hypothetical protein [Metabacillus halosaccharovorans]|uniref:hypothetical protein n=1 Tax=Metabacillus halosaccharovorans TaxID=930124 RepID=UPI00203DD0AE|nr:hypothetical protein [Metabacillus halosaccharovorans]MCM3443080.1 hypothetical protein [Metabacillus halosaccharovorans]